MFELPPEITFALRTLSDAGFEAYVVGGAVRDILMALPVHDYDITTSASPEQMREAFSGCVVVPTGEKHGTLTVVIGEYPIEITVFRSDGAYSDGRRPDCVTQARTLEEDLRRRDFTVNAVAYSPDAGFVDPFHGADDIKNGLVRCVGDPCSRLSEDYLRILRAVRFCSTLGFSVDKATSDAVHRRCGDISGLSGERVFSELCKLLCGKNVRYALTEFSDCIFQIIPELSVTLGYNQSNPNHSLTLYDHTVSCVANTDPEPVMRLAALLHDIGKPACRTVDASGVAHYRGHPDVSEQLARGILYRLRAPGKLTDEVCTLIKYHDVRLAPDRAAVRRFMSRIGSENALNVLRFKRADTLSQNPAYYCRLDELKELYETACDIDKCSDALKVSDLEITGDDLLALGIPEGREVGRLLQTLLDGVIDGKLENNRETLMKAAANPDFPE